MEKHQEDAYKQAIEEYRVVSHARIAKLSDVDLNTVVGIIPRRQISNYFVQFRKVLSFFLFSVNLFYSILVMYCCAFFFLIGSLYFHAFRLQIIHYWFGEFTVMRMLFVLPKSYIQWVLLALNVPWTE